MKIALSIAGSDPSGGAGIQADLKVFHAHGVYGQAAVTLLTAQNSQGVTSVWPIPDAQVAAQIDALWEDMPPQAVKTGAFASPESILRVAHSLRSRALPLVVDPILRPTQGASFAESDLAASLRDVLLPLAALITPNREEAQILTGLTINDAQGAAAAGHALCRMGARAALVKGGHLVGDPIDVLCLADGSEHEFSDPRIRTQHTHGTGCALSASIAARLALGLPLVESVTGARTWLRLALSAPLGIGRGRGPINHFARG